MASKLPRPFSDRDFVERRVMFHCQELNEFVSVFNQCDEEESYPLKKGNERAYTILGGNFIYEANGYMHIWFLSQVESKISIPLFILSSTLNTAYQKWAKRLRKAVYKYIQSNNKS